MTASRCPHCASNRQTFEFVYQGRPVVRCLACGCPIEGGEAEVRGRQAGP